MLKMLAAKTKICLLIAPLHGAYDRSIECLWLQLILYHFHGIHTDFSSIDTNFLILCLLGKISYKNSKNALVIHQLVQCYLLMHLLILIQDGD